jgi:hypothetical protein
MRNYLSESRQYDLVRFSTTPRTLISFLGLRIYINPQSPLEYQLSSLSVPLSLTPNYYYHLLRKRNPIAKMGSLPNAEIRKLFAPLRIGTMDLSHRIIMAPLTRKRCPAGIPTPLVAEYYAQRATPGGLLISEGMHPSIMAGNMYGIPGMYTPEHIRGWKVVTHAVHAKGAYMACQLWHVSSLSQSSSSHTSLPPPLKPVLIENVQNSADASQFPSNSGDVSHSAPLQRILGW